MIPRAPLCLTSFTSKVPVPGITDSSKHKGHAMTNSCIGWLSQKNSTCYIKFCFQCQTSRCLIHNTPCLFKRHRFSTSPIDKDNPITNHKLTMSTQTNSTNIMLTNVCLSRSHCWAGLSLSILVTANGPTDASTVPNNMICQEMVDGSCIPTLTLHHEAIAIGVWYQIHM